MQQFCYFSKNQNEYFFDYKGGKLYFFPFFNRILQMIEISQTDVLSEFEKIELTFNLLFKIDETTVKFSTKEKNILIGKVNKYLLKTDKKASDNQNNEKVIDFIKDGEYIYSSFFNAYHIDLKEKIDKLLWIDFITLLNNLPDNSKMKEVIRIRKMKPPILDKKGTNKKQIQDILELKNYYRLR